MTGTASQLVVMLAEKIAAGDDTLYDVKPHKEKRSLSQNAFYWKILGQVADKLRISKSKLHNDMLRHYGQTMTVGEEVVCVTLPDDEESEKTADENDSVHLKKTSATVQGKNGKTYRYWVMLRGSHDYTVKEMSVLVDGLIQEAEQIGVPTITPRELEEIRRHEQMLEDRRNAQKNKSDVNQRTDAQGGV